MYKLPKAMMEPLFLVRSVHLLIFGGDSVPLPLSEDGDEAAASSLWVSLRVCPMIFLSRAIPPRFRAVFSSAIFVRKFVKERTTCIVLQGIDAGYNNSLFWTTIIPVFSRE